MRFKIIYGEGHIFRDMVTMLRALERDKWEKRGLVATQQRDLSYILVKYISKV